MSRPFLIFWLLLPALLTLPRPCHSQAPPVLVPAPVRYTVAFPNAAHHEARVTVDFPPGPTTAPLELLMARASPGRYALHEFAKNVYDLTATDAATGRELMVNHFDPYGWRLTVPAGTAVRVQYTLFANRADGTYAGIDAERAHLNLPAVLLYAPAFQAAPHRVRFEVPAGSGWRVATQLPPETDGSYAAPHLQYLLDSPCLLGPLETRTWTQGGQQVAVSVLHRGTTAEVDTLAARTRRITMAAERVWGELPRYDFGTYTFLADYLPTADGDGMEHRNSTSLTTPTPLSAEGGTMREHLGTISHEFFHAWNVERLRPADLEPFDFQRANRSDLLWLAEGFTQYYGDLLFHRAGLLPDAAYLKTLTRLVQQAQLPGAARFSPVEMSRQAPFVDAARFVDPTNRPNTYVSYYTIGGANALALDLTLRARRHTLDELMRVLWRDFGSKQTSQTPQRPYTLPDVQRALAEVAQDSAFAGQFVRRHLTGHQPHDWSALLAPAGLAIRPAHPGQAWLGPAAFEFSAEGITLANNALLNTPLYEAGLDRGDVLTHLGGRRLRSEKDLTKALRAHRPGDVVPAEVRQRGLPARPVSLRLVADPTLEVVPAANPDATQQAFRAAWWK